jgi:hypothetical protein
MPTEAQYTRLFLKTVRETYPRAVVDKFNDSTTSGLEDSAWTDEGRTLWIEFKKDKPALTEIQRLRLLKRDNASDGRAIVVVFKRGRVVDLYDASYDTRGALRTDMPWTDAIAALRDILLDGTAWQ